MFSPQQPTTVAPRITESLGRTRPSKAQRDSPAHAGGGKSGAAPAHRQADLRAILKTSRLEESLFSLSYLTTHDNELSPRLSWLFLIVEDSQWLSFAFSIYLHKDMPEVLNLALDPLRAVPDYDSFVIVNIATILLVFTVVGLIGVVTLIMQRRGKVPLLALRVLRLLCALIMTALSIPIATFLIMGLHCVDGKMPKWGTACYTSPHLPLYIFNLLSLVIFVPLLVLGVTLFIETDPASKSPVSKAHSRMDKIDVIVRLVLVLGDVMLYKANETFHWAFMIISAILLCYLSFNMSRTQPYYNLTTTAFRSGMCMSAAFAMIASMFVRGLWDSTQKVIGLFWFPRASLDWLLEQLSPTATIANSFNAPSAHGIGSCARRNRSKQLH
ncbi:hypothetical protein BCR44DRAFT_1277436 [Catenaria anguillulae PL171]|uniref:Uncharacterized protein n=1 Tax=Catenaria anguillulae PL171 TaxID=765915 RepID=A0A1Y2HB98_9FUNG|nr:hypothetical protein BCR44DRAFT_1277436 [Catenaria anguillulae PL171]